CWLDARAPDEATLERLTAEISAAAQAAAGEHQVAVSVRQESVTVPVQFDPGLRDQLAAALAARDIAAPVLPTGAGHDAGVLAARLPTAMLFVRNPSGVSHSPREHAGPADCEAGGAARAGGVGGLGCRARRAARPRRPRRRADRGRGGPLHRGNSWRRGGPVSGRDPAAWADSAGPCQRALARVPSRVARADPGGYGNVLDLAAAHVRGRRAA